MRALSWAAGIAMLTAAGCNHRAPAAGDHHVVLGVSILRISLPVFVAEQEGIFEKHGLDVELRRYDTAQPLADELATGRIDAGGYVAFPILFGARNTPPRIRVITAIVEDQKHPISYLLVRKGSDIHDVAALEGRRVGILPTVAYQHWMEAVVRAAGLGPDDVTITPVAPPLEVESLASGGIDALFTGDPMATEAIARGIAVPATQGPPVPPVLGTPFPFGTFALSDQLVDSRPAVARALRDAIDEAVGRVMAGQAAARAAMEPYVRDPEKPYVGDYPDARYLTSSELTPALLERALRLTGTPLHAADVALP